MVRCRCPKRLFASSPQLILAFILKTSKQTSKNVQMQPEPQASYLLLGCNNYIQSAIWLQHKNVNVN